jgi:hypothetical protein
MVRRSGGILYHKITSICSVTECKIIFTLVRSLWKVIVVLHTKNY